MAFDTQTRNRLNNFVADARELLTEEFTNQFQVDYGLDPDTGEISDMDRLTHLDDARKSTALVLRETIQHYYANLPTKKKKPEDDYKTLIERVIREQAFTVLNRLCAVRMAEARELVIEAIGQGTQSQGFQLYGHVIGNSLGETGAAYEQYLFSVFDEFAFDLPVLFDRYSPQGRLFPRETVLKELIEHINHPEINHLWAEDETIGWIYQYFNSKEERKAMRDASQAPRNSRELAVRNQFFTPRYVVEFLTDNTLGRIWYEMRKGETSLTDACTYLVRRPNEIFLDEGQEVPEATDDNPAADLTQEELLNQPVHIPHRPLKDPREIRMLDPACGSMHFGLYAFDLYLKIYDEAWDIEAAHPSSDSRPFASLAGTTPHPSFTSTYPDKPTFLRDVPRLIIEHNIHGIDIDPRAVQIAGLSLWLRAQRAWKSQGIAAGDRPQVTRSNIVCAEPMPGDEQQLEAFCKTLDPAIAQMVTAIFEEMKLAGEAGSLLKIEQEITALVAAAKKQWEQKPKPKQLEFFGGDEVVKEEQLEFDLSGITDQQFFEQAEETIFEALRKFASETSEGGFRRKLFAGDAEKGFAFIELCRKKFDASLMNPPFGLSSLVCKKYVDDAFPNSKRDLYSAFVDRTLASLDNRGLVGCISSRAGFFLNSFENWRLNVVFRNQIELFADLGVGVLDSALVSTAAYCISKRTTDSRQDSVFIRLLGVEPEAQQEILKKEISSCEASSRKFELDTTELLSIPGAPLSYWCPRGIRRLFSTLPPLEDDDREARVGLQTSDDFRFVRLWTEVPPETLLTLPVGNRPRSVSDFVNATNSKLRWASFSKGGGFKQFIHGQHLVVDWLKDGRQLKTYNVMHYGSVSRNVRSESKYFCPGITWSYLPQTRGSFRALPSGSVFSVGGPAIFASYDSLLAIMGVLNSDMFFALLRLFMPRGTSDGGQTMKFEVGYVSRIPFPTLDSELSSELAGMVGETWDVLEKIESKSELTPFFRVNLSRETKLKSLAEWHQQQRDELEASISELNLRRRDINEVVFQMYDANPDVRSWVESEVGRNPSSNCAEQTIEFLPGEQSTLDFSLTDSAFFLVSWATGVLFGRWKGPDRIETTDASSQSQDDVFFLSVPAYSPAASLPSEGGTPILVDDRSSEHDLATLIGNLLNSLEAPDNQRLLDDVTSALKGSGSGVSSLRRWLDKEFFAMHLTEYSQSRRTAPIYWPISTESGSYTLWFYYHRLTDQTLYKAVNDFVDPKLKQTLRQLADLRAIKDRTSSQEKELAQLTELESELEQFKADLLEIAKLWKPNLNDGVQITAAPLWKFFRLTKWRNKLKKTWSELESGKYDWAHLALSIWPDRVLREKCTTDRSIAIAHDLEEQLWHEVEVTSVSRGGRETTKMEWQPKDLTEAELDAIVAEVKAR